MTHYIKIADAKMSRSSNQPYFVFKTPFGMAYSSLSQKTKIGAKLIELLDLKNKKELSQFKGTKFIADISIESVEYENRVTNKVNINEIYSKEP